ncbi:MAG: hypothetical protein ACQEP8_03140 [Chlamydiota bacterium]
MTDNFQSEDNKNEEELEKLLQELLPNSSESSDKETDKTSDSLNISNEELSVLFKEIFDENEDSSAQHQSPQSCQVDFDSDFDELSTIINKVEDEDRPENLEELVEDIQKHQQSSNHIEQEPPIQSSEDEKAPLSQEETVSELIEESPQEHLEVAPTHSIDDQEEKDQPLDADEDLPLYSDDQNFISSRDFRKKLTLLVAGAFIIFLSLIAGYRYFTNQNRWEQIATAKTLADLSMALSHVMTIPEEVSFDSQDRVFIEFHLNQVLPVAYREKYPLDNNNLIQGTDYKVTIIADKALEHFLLIARPASNYKNFILTRPAIIIDSTSMELRKIYDYSPWKAVLEEAMPLENLNFDKISTLAKEEELLSLSTLGDYFRDFTPPQKLGQIKAGAENIVYNAPRYFPFSAPLSSQAILVGSSHADSQDIEQLHDLSEKFSSFTDLVIYSTQGLSGALNIQAAFEHFPETPKFLIGFLDFDNQGLISEASILDEELLKQHRQEIDNRLKTLPPQPQEPEETVYDEEIVHPIRVDLEAVIDDHKENLNLLSTDISLLLADAQHNLITNFSEKLYSLTDEYIDTLRVYHQRLTETLTDLFNLYVEDQSSEELWVFQNALNDLGLHSYLDEELKDKLTLQIKKDALQSRQFDKLVQEIYDSSNLEELNKVALQINTILENYRPEEQEIIAQGRTALQSAVIEQLSDFLFMPSPEFQGQIPAETTHLIDNILSNTGINDTEVHNFYIGEFDKIIQQYQLSAAATNSDLEVSEAPTELPSESLETEDALAQNTDEHKGQTSSSARIGQQILVQERLQPAGLSRDERLFQAIELLEAAKDPHLWGEILEAYNLMIETPQNEIFSILSSGLGLLPHEQPFASSIIAGLEQYNSSKRKLANISRRSRYDALFGFYQDSQTPNLTMLLEEGRFIQQQTQALKESLQEYISRLHNFAQAYEAAGKEGFFASAKDHTFLASSKLSYKIQLANRFKEKITPYLQQLNIAASEVEAIASQGLQEIQQHRRINPKDATNTNHQIEVLAFPNLGDLHIAEQFDLIASIEPVMSP